MANQEHVKIILKGVETWNKWRGENPDLDPDLSRANLREIDIRKANLIGVDLSEANLSQAFLVEADLEGAYLEGTNLSRANLREIDICKANLIGADLTGAGLGKANLCKAFLGGANLEGANLKEADLGEANLIRANFRGADLSKANLSGADLSGAFLDKADLNGVNLGRANLNGANLSEANLSGAFLGGARFSGVNLKGAILEKAVFNETILADIDLSEIKKLSETVHLGPSSISTNSLVRSKGKLQNDFLLQCGLSPWEISLAKLYNPDLRASEISEMLSIDFFPKRTQGPLFIGGIFISYSHDDSDFVEKIERKLKEEGAAVWRDVHGLVAGRLTKQITDQIRINDILLIILSKASVNSDWVENELDQARQREKKESKDIICPIALDDSWKDKIKGDPLWRKVTDYNVLDFSGWENEDSFDEQVNKLISGIKKNYPIFYK